MLLTQQTRGDPHTYISSPYPKLSEYEELPTLIPAHMLQSTVTQPRGYEIIPLLRIYSLQERKMKVHPLLPCPASGQHSSSQYPSCITPFSRELPGTPHDYQLLSKRARTNLQLLFYQTYRAPSYSRCLLCNMDPVLEQIDSKTLIVKKKMKKNPNATEKKIERKTVKQTSI